jgi:hypothetical protein
MTIDEAIKQLESFHSWFGQDYCDKDLEAIKLGIEAMKALQKIRTWAIIAPRPLPGETR